MKKLLIATGNRGKVIEFQELLLGLGVELLIPADIGLNIEVEEDGQTYAENAAKKARAYSMQSGLITLADDSGVEVDALGGAPGIYSARYSPLLGAKDADRRRYLLENLAGKPQPWSAHFHSTVAIGLPDDQVFFAEGKCFGQIIAEERGENGFGYDAIFLLPELNRTMAELEKWEKNRVSHRALAVKAARPILERIFSD